MGEADGAAGMSRALLRTMTCARSSPARRPGRAGCRRLGRRPKTAIGACKRAVYEGGSRPLVDGLRLEASEFVTALSTPEALNAMRSYVDTLERTGELPVYDFDQEIALDQRGYFA